MKNLTKTIALLSTVAALSAQANISVTDTDKTSFDIGGEIQPECKVSNSALSSATALDLSSTSAQTAANVSIWCNTGQAAASTTYSSQNAGFLVNETGKKIAYKIDIDGTASDLALTSDQVVSQESGQGVEGADASKSVSIKPVVTGFEYAGTYSDTIEVTVAYN
jgi:spore coat protein U-like protein